MLNPTIAQSLITNARTSTLPAAITVTTKPAAPVAIAYRHGMEGAPRELGRIAASENLTPREANTRVIGILAHAGINLRPAPSENRHVYKYDGNGGIAFDAYDADKHLDRQTAVYEVVVPRLRPQR